MKKIILILLILNPQFSILNSLWAQEIGVEYDEQGRVFRSSHGVVDANDRLAVLITYTYDEDGNPTQTVYKYRYIRQSDGTWQLVSIRLNNEELLDLIGAEKPFSSETTSP